MSAVSSPSATRAAIERLVAPKTIAILGASSDRTKVGALPLSFLRKYGYAGREASLDKIAELHRRFRFVFVDAQDIRTWGGTAYEWSNATHVNRANMRRLLRYVVAHSAGALR